MATVPPTPDAPDTSFAARVNDRIVAAVAVARIPWNRVAEICGLNVQTVRARRNGSAAWQLDDIDALADVLGMTAEKLTSE